MDDSSLGVLIGAGICLGFICLLFAGKEKQQVDKKEQEKVYAVCLACIDLMNEIHQFCPASYLAIHRFFIFEKKRVIYSYYQELEKAPDYHAGQHSVLMVKSILSSLAERTKDGSLPFEERQKIEDDAMAVFIMDHKTYGDRLINWLYVRSEQQS